MNQKLRCLIVDDEPIGIDLIKAYVNKIIYLELAGCYEDAQSTLDYLQHHQVDLLFSDIQMPGFNGLDMISSLPYPPVTIFISAHRDFAPEGFETGAIDYLVKPVTFMRFEKAVNKARDYINMKRGAKKSDDTGHAFLFVKTENSYLKLLYEEIVYLQAKGDYVSIKTDQKKNILWRITMSDLEHKLTSGPFIRVHKSYMVNVNSVRLVYAGHLILTDNTEIPLSKSYKAELNKRIGIN